MIDKSLYVDVFTSLVLCVKYFTDIDIDVLFYMQSILIPISSFIITFHE